MGGAQGMVEFLGSGDFDTPSHKHYAFIARVENKHTYQTSDVYYIKIIHAYYAIFKRRGREEKKNQ